jgi:hypothetical protein
MKGQGSLWIARHQVCPGAQVQPVEKRSVERKYYRFNQFFVNRSDEMYLIGINQSHITRMNQIFFKVDVTFKRALHGIRYHEMIFLVRFVLDHIRWRSRFKHHGIERSYFVNIPEGDFWNYAF